MATIITKNSSTASSVPLAAQLVQGELAVNVTDKRLFTENSGGTVVELGTNPSSLSTGNLAFTGTGNRITGDFSNATVANRVLFQTSTTNGQSNLNVIPNGTGNASIAQIFNGSDPINSSWLLAAAYPGTISIQSGQTGTGTYLPMTMWTGGSERVRVDTSGNVGIGTSSMTRFFNLYDTTTNAQTAYFKSTQASGGAGFVAYNNGGEAATFQINGSSNTSYAGANSVNIGSITNNNLAFITNNTERARIDSSGNLLVGTTGTFDNVSFLKVQALGGVSTKIAGTGLTSQMSFFNDNGRVGYIGTNGTTTSYNTSSDYRLKEAIAPMTGALAKVALLKPVTYKWKVDGSDGQGFIAHELAEVEAGCVTGEKDAVDADGNPQYQGIDTSFLVATLAAAIQELKAIVDAQGAEIAALKSI